MQIVNDAWLDDVATRVVVAPAYGSFAAAAASTVTAEGEWVERGQVVGHITSGAGSVEVTSPFRGCLVAYLVEDGDRVQPGKPLVHIEAV